MTDLGLGVLLVMGLAPITGLLAIAGCAWALHTLATWDDREP